MPTLIPVRVRDCTCPETPHDGHHVLVAPTISLEGGIAAEQVMVKVLRTKPLAAGSSKLAEAAHEASMITALTYAWAPVFVLHGAKDWDLCDEQGEPRDFDVEEVLGDYAMARLVADKCGDLGYGSAVLAPFLERQAKPSANGRTKATTSPRRRPTRK